MDSNDDYYENEDKKMEMKTKDRGNKISINRFLEELQNFESTFKDNSEEISSSNDFNEDSDDDEMKTAREDSDSNEEWSDANSVTTMNMSLDHENGIFHITLEEQCISTKDEDSFSSQKEQSEQNNFFCDTGNDNLSNDFSSTSRLKQDEIKGVKRRTLVEFTDNIKKRKIVFDEEEIESHIEHKNESKIREEKCSFSQNASTKHESYFSRTRNKKSKCKYIKYKEITRTGSSLSTDDDEIIPIKAKRSKRKFYKRTIDFTICQTQVRLQSFYFIFFIIILSHIIK